MECVHACARIERGVENERAEKKTESDTQEQGQAVRDQGRSQTARDRKVDVDGRADKSFREAHKHLILWKKAPLD